MWRFFKDFMIYGFASILGKMAAIFLMPIYTSILTKEEYGAMALITSCAGIIGLVSNLNIHSGIARDYYEEGINRKTLVSTGFFSILGIASFTLLMMLLTKEYWGCTVLGLEEIYLPAFCVMLFTIPCGSLQSYFAIMTRFLKKPVHYSIGTLIQLTLQISISVFCIVYLRTGVVGIFLGMAISELIASFYFAFLNRQYIGFNFDSCYLKYALIFAIPTLPAILAGWVDSSVGQIIIGKTISKADLGVYSIALSLASAFTLVSTAFGNVWYPFLYENYKKETFQIDIRRLFTVLSIVLIFITVMLSMFSREIILLLSNPEYLDASKYLTLLCIPMSIYLMFPFASSGVTISRDTKYIAVSYITGSIMNVVGLYLSVSHYGILAVPLCLGLSRVTAYTILYRVSEKKLSYNLPNYYLIALTLIAIGCYFMQTLNFSIVYRILVSITFTILLLIYLQSKVNLKQLLAKIKKN